MKCLVRDHFEVEVIVWTSFYSTFAARVDSFANKDVDMETGNAPFKREDSRLTNPKPPSILYLKYGK